MTDRSETGADALDERYHHLKAELGRLRSRADADCVPDPTRVRERIRTLAESVDGDLLVFVANDFGYPAAYRPEGTSRTIQNDVREAILADKYDDSNDDLADLRTALLDLHPGLHKAIVAEHDGHTARYHLPEGTAESTNFLTVREIVGLVDYTTNSAQADQLSNTY